MYVCVHICIYIQRYLARWQLLWAFWVITDGQWDGVLTIFFFKIVITVLISLIAIRNRENSYNVLGTGSIHCKCSYIAILLELSEHFTFVQTSKLKQQNYFVKKMIQGIVSSNTKMSKEHLKSKAWMSTNFYQHILHTSMGWEQTRKEVRMANLCREWLSSV